MRPPRAVNGPIVPYSCALANWLRRVFVEGVVGFEPTRPFGLALFKSATFNRAPSHPHHVGMFSTAFTVFFAVEMNFSMAIRANELKIV